MVIGWPILAGIAVVLVLRWREVDKVYLVALVALTPFLLIPLVVADVIAWFSRSPTLRIAAVAVSAACLFTVAPFDAVIGCGSNEADDAITIMTANVESRGGQPDAIAANIAAADPDVVVLQEAGGRFLEAISDQPELEPWTARSNELPDARNGTVIWSKWPLSDVRFDDLEVRSWVRAVVESPEGRFTVAGLHAASPSTSEDLALWHDHFARLNDMPTDEPMIMAGDFNATEDHRPFRRLLDQGWTDVHDNKGCGPDLTWPADGLPMPVMRLDHILVTDDFEVLSTEIGDPGGSDHHPVISGIRFADG